MPNLSVNVPPDVTRLVKHLRGTGTGETKLSQLMELGKTAKNGGEFLASAKEMMPLATWNKIEEYLAGEGATDMKDFKSGPQEKGRVESRSESQSSIPEYTVGLQDKAVQLREPGTTKTRQLGADVIVDPKTDPLNEDNQEDSDEETGKTEESPVADQSAEEAKETVGRMKSVPKLESVVMNDKRVTVQQAAQDRLNELKKG